VTGVQTCALPISFRFARAGHNPPLLYDAPTRQILGLDPPGPALGICKPEQFVEKVGEQQHELAPGSVLLLYTDGIVEAADAERRLFGEDRLKQVFLENSGRPSRRMVEAIVTAVRQYTGNAPMDDDETLVVLRRLTP
jgi:sigma-B regulation protein RsbU (phosphoserine phosphatase)